MAVGDIAGPVLIDGGDEAFFLAFQQVPDGIARGGRTGVVVVTPRHVGLGLDVGGETADIEIGQRLQVLFGKRIARFRYNHT